MLEHLGITRFCSKADYLHVVIWFLCASEIQFNQLWRKMTCLHRLAFPLFTIVRLKDYVYEEVTGKRIYFLQHNLNKSDLRFFLYFITLTRKRKFFQSRKLSWKKNLLNRAVKCAYFAKDNYVQFSATTRTHYKVKRT